MASDGAGDEEQDLFGSGDEMDEHALFGSEEEDAAAAPPAVPASAGTPSVAASPASRAAGELDERELFGSDDEEDVGGAEAGEVDERALFGSDEEEPAAEPAAAAEPRSPVASDVSDMDEHDIFGDLSDDEPEKVEDVLIRRRPVPSLDRDFVGMRLPNVLSIDQTAYHPDSISQSLLEGYKEFKSTLNKSSVRLLNPENCVRWRFKRDADGQMTYDEDGRPHYESNARIVEWEDGSKTLCIGSESFDLSEIDDHAVIFEENTNDVKVCHGTLGKRFVATPKDLKSTTHEMLKRSQYSKYERNRRSLLMSQEEQDAHQQLLQLQADQRERQRRGERGGKRSLEDGATLTRAFLEDDARSDVGSKRAKTG